MNADEILSELEAKRKGKLKAKVLRKLGLPSSVVDTLVRIGPTRIAGDYIIPTTERLVGLNNNVPLIPDGWVCFASSGNGDLWLVRRSDPHDVAFLDHDKESRARAAVLGIDLGKWIELAWYMRAHDAAYEFGAEPANKRRVAAARKFLEALAKGLSRKYPYRLS